MICALTSPVLGNLVLSLEMVPGLAPNNLPLVKGILTHFCVSPHMFSFVARSASVVLHHNVDQ